MSSVPRIRGVASTAQRELDNFQQIVREETSPSKLFQGETNQLIHSEAATDNSDILKLNPKVHPGVIRNTPLNFKELQELNKSSRAPHSRITNPT